MDELYFVSAKILYSTCEKMETWNEMKLASVLFPPEVDGIEADTEIDEVVLSLVSGGANKLILMSTDSLVLRPMRCGQYDWTNDFSSDT